MSVERPPLPVVDFTRIGPSVGERFPDIGLPDQTGRIVDLHAHSGGRRALIVFHRSANW
jgi:peroxiredoxin